MKKLYILAAAAMLACGAAQANTITFSYGADADSRTEIVNGESITFNEYESTFYEKTNDYDVTFDPHIYVTADYEANFNLRVQSLNGTEIQCCAGYPVGECVAGTDITKELRGVPAGQAVNCLIEYMAMGIQLEDIPELNIAVSAVDINDSGIATEFTIVFDPTATDGIENVMTIETAPVEYFNLQGVRVANPEGGIFIRRQGKSVSKVIR